MVRRVRGLSDRAIAWIFITPTILLLLAINIYPLIWTVYLSFTNYRANRPNREIEWVGTRNYERILSDEGVWENLQRTAHFVTFTMLFQVLLGFGLALLLHKRFKGHGLWTTLILLPMMLSPAVVGMYWKYL
ncbi:MAG: sugar ABC transporter permease, partial [Pseudomonadota bacterium]